MKNQSNLHIFSFPRSSFQMSNGNRLPRTLSETWASQFLLWIAMNTVTATVTMLKEKELMLNRRRDQRYVMIGVVCLIWGQRRGRFSS